MLVQPLQEDMRQKATEMEGLTGFKLRETVFVPLRYTIEPTRDGKTDRQHIPDTEEDMTEIK